jgi:hypothetical protein
MIVLMMLKYLCEIYQLLDLYLQHLGKVYETIPMSTRCW